MFIYLSGLLLNKTKIKFDRLASYLWILFQAFLCLLLRYASNLIEIQCLSILLCALTIFKKSSTFER